MRQRSCSRFSVIRKYLPKILWLAVFIPFGYTRKCRTKQLVLLSQRANSYTMPYHQIENNWKNIYIQTYVSIYFIVEKHSCLAASILYLARYTFLHLCALCQLRLHKVPYRRRQLGICQLSNEWLADIHTCVYTTYEYVLLFIYLAAYFDSRLKKIILFVFVADYWNRAKAPATLFSKIHVVRRHISFVLTFTLLGF